jgi:integrase
VDDELKRRLKAYLDAETGQVSAKPERTIGQMYDEWLSILPPWSNTTRSRKSARHWLSADFTLAGQVFRLADLTPSQVTPVMLLAWQNMMTTVTSARGKPLAHGSVDQIRMAVQAMFAYAMATNEVMANPFRSRAVPRLPTRDRKREGYFTAEQVEAACKHLPLIDAWILRHTFATGARSSIIRELRKSEIHAVDKCIRGKSKGRLTTVFIPSKTLIEMERLCLVSPSEYVYPNPKDPAGAPIPVSTYRLHRERAFAAAGITSLNGEKPVAPHLRHGRAMDILEKTGDITLAQKMLGHTNIQMTLRYATKSGHQAVRLRAALDDDEKPDT